MSPSAPHDDADQDFAAATFAIVMLLSATSGIVDAVAFSRFGVFVANQTGNLVIVSLSLAREQPVQTQIASVLALVTFTVGVFIAVLIRRALLRRLSQARTRVVMLSAEAALIALTGVGVVIWGTERFAYVAVVMLSLSQAIQAAVVTRIIGLAVQTVVINTALVQSAEAWALGRRRAAAIAFGTPIGYLIGAFAGALLLRFPPPTALLSALVTAAAALAIAHVIRVRGAAIE